MIRKQDILDRAAEWRLRPEVVEKDYVLGWLLASLGTLPLRGQWILKGGTCIKKCYFETYRFSEDLDFSLTEEAPYTAEAILESLGELAKRASELSGIEFPADAILVRDRRNRRRQPTFEGRIGYRGPLGFPGTPKILFDLTQHEHVFEESAARSVLHPYPDDLPIDATVLTYSFHELLAEKTRALFERARPRDLYDVTHLLENAPEGLDLESIRGLFVRKCESKELAPPTSSELARVVADDVELRSEWHNMLAHQLPALPELDLLLVRLPSLLGWLDVPTPVLPTVRLTPVPVPAGSSPVVSAGIQYWGSSLPIETIRFAGTNRLLIEFDYHGRSRRAEPYSLRRASTGNLLLYAWEVGATHIKAFNVDEMQGVRPTDAGFAPRYRTEFTASGPLQVLPTRTPKTRSLPGRTRRGAGPRAPSVGSVYIFECPYCNKRFRHRRNNPSLGKHKRKDSFGYCSGRRGYLVEVR